MKFIDGDKVIMDLSVVSSIMNEVGIMGLLDYISVETHKHIIADEYINFHKIQPLLFNKSESRWKKSMNQLCKIGLVTCNNGQYITRTKLKDWKSLNAKYTKYGGKIIIDITKLYRDSKERNVTDLLYLNIISSVMSYNTYSRGWIEGLTGYSPFRQRQVEKNNKDIIEVYENLQPITKLQIKDIEKRNLPVIKANIYTSKMAVIRNKKGKVLTTQAANKIRFKNEGLVYYKRNKKANYNKSFWVKDEVVCRESIERIIDLSTNAISDGIVVASYDKMDCVGLDYDKVQILTENGRMINLRGAINNRSR